MERGRVKFWLMGLLIAHGVYAAAFIARTSFVVEGQRYYCLLDDAMITLRFAQNIAEGYGPVWNRDGSRVEGFTSPLWTFLLAGVCCLGFDTPTTCLIVQILGIPCMWGLALATAHLAQEARYPPFVSIVAAGFTLFFFNLNHFALWGMETGLAALAVSVGLIWVQRRIRVGTGSIGSMWWVAPAVLLRPELAALSAYVCLVQMVFLRGRRHRTLIGFACGSLLVCVYVLWRHHYYGEWVPNTYTLKVTNWPLLDRLHAAMRSFPRTVITLGPCCLLSCIGSRGPRRPGFWLLFVLPVLAIAYEVCTGGDHFRYDRYVLPIVPALFVGAVAGLVRLTRVLMMLLDRRVRRTLLWSGTVLGILSLNVVNLKHALLLAPTPSLLRASRPNVQTSLIIERYTERDAVIAVGCAGTVPCLVERRYVDLLGKCDLHIAHLPARPGLFAGHNKFDFAWSVEHYRPDVIDPIGRNAFFDTDVRSQYGVRRYLIDDQPILLLVRNDTARIHGGEPLTWHAVDRLFSSFRID